MPKFGQQRLIWQNKPVPQGAAKPASAGASGVEISSAGLDSAIDKQKQEHLKDYYEQLRLQRTAKEHANFLNELNSWQHPPQVEKSRTGNVSEAENKANYLKRHAVLSSAFLEDLGPGRFRVNFFVNGIHNELAEKKVGAADMLPPNAMSISIKRANGTSIEKAVRMQNPATKRIGYFIKNSDGSLEYAAVHTGDEITILETREIKGNPFDDQVVKDEHDQIFHEGAMKENVMEVPEMDRTDVGRGTHGALASLNRSIGLVGTTMGNMPSQKPTGSPGNGPLPASSSDGLLKPRDSAETGGSLVDIAKGYAAASAKGDNRFREGFQNIDGLKGGRLGCAYVASTILKDAGYLDQIYDNVDATANALKAKDWQTIDSNQQPEAGDVVVWTPLPITVTTSGDTMGGHKHIGIYIGNGQVVDNNAGWNDPRGGTNKKGDALRGGPRVGPLNRVMGMGPDGKPIPRKIECFLRPPRVLQRLDRGGEGNAPASVNTPPLGYVDRKSNAGSGETFRPNKSTGENTSSGVENSNKYPELGRIQRMDASAINRKTGRWRPMIEQACNNADLANLVQAIMDVESSGGKPNAIGRNNNGTVDRGLMQLNSKFYTNPNIMDPATNIRTGANALAGNLRRFNGDVGMAVAAYNCGHAKRDPNSHELIGIPSRTQDYVQKVLSRYVALGGRIS